MSGVNITCTVGNQLGNGGGEMKFEVSTKDSCNIATCIASEIVNEILENALDIATMGGVTGLHCDTIAFSMDDTLCTFSNNSFNQKLNKLDNNREEINDECPDIKDIIDGLSGIHIPKNSLEEPIRLDVEMKRLMSEMMSPPYDIVNYDSRKDGVGDQSIEDFIVNEDSAQSVDDCLVDMEKNKLVEKKTRVTDLVMNSKQVLSEYMMSDESRKLQEEWEESNEKVIQVIELDYVKPDEILKGENSENTIEEEIKEELFESIENEQMDLVDLDFPPKLDAIPNNIEGQDGASGEKVPDEKLNLNEKDEEMAGASSSKSNSLDTAMAKEICKRKFENLKKKKWNINLKFWGKKKQRDQEENTDIHLNK